jgi:hypothetical protein
MGRLLPIAAFVVVVFGLIGLSVVRADPSANVTIHVTPISGGGLCSTTPPAAVATAGYTVLIFCSDFTDPSMANINTWLDCKGASNPIWQDVDWFTPSHCNQITVEADNGDGANPQVLRIDSVPSQFQTPTCTATWCNQGIGTCWKGGGGLINPGYNNPGCAFAYHSTSIYIEITFRATAASWNNLEGQILEYWTVGSGGGNNSSNPIFNPSSNGFYMEYDAVEIHPEPGGGIPQTTYMQAGCLGWHNSITPGWCQGPVITPNWYDVSKYHTYGFLVMSNKNVENVNNSFGISRVCGSVDGAWIACRDYVGDPPPAAPSDFQTGFFDYAMGGLIMYTGGKQNVSTLPTTMYVKNVRVFSCPTWQDNANTCQHLSGYPTFPTQVP